MALLGQQFVERLTGMWPTLQRQPLALQFQKAKTAPTSSAALEAANAIYAGTASFTLEHFASLRWLDHFAHSGRQLLMCHALRLLEGWQAQKFKPASLMEATLLVHRLANAASCFGSRLDAGTLAPVVSAIKQQLRHLQHMHPRQPDEMLAKALAFRAVAQVLQDGSACNAQSLALLETAVPRLIGPDGSATCHDVLDYVHWIGHLLEDEALLAQPVLRHALDRAGPYLSMLLGADQRYVFNRTLSPLADIITTMPLRHALQGKVGRLAGGKTVLIATPAHAQGFGGLSLSSHLQHLIDATSFMHDPSTDLAITDMAVSTSPEGQMLMQATAKSRRQVFLAAKGDDLRIEDQMVDHREACWMSIQLHEDAKASVSRNGMQATIARDGRHLWQLTLKGATILPGDDDQRLVVQARAPVVNWALQRMARTHTRTDKSAAPELPF